MLVKLRHFAQVRRLLRNLLAPTDKQTQPLQDSILFRIAGKESKLQCLKQQEIKAGDSHSKPQGTLAPSLPVSFSSSADLPAACAPELDVAEERQV